MSPLIRLCTVATLALLVLSGTAAADSTGTCRFTGTARLDNAKVPDGTIVAAIIGDRVYATVTPTGYGDSTYSIEVQPRDGEHYPEGTEVVFQVGGCKADQTGFVKAGENTRLDLTARSATTSSSGSSSAWVIAGLVLACLLELVVVGGVVYLTVSDWSR